MLDYGFATLADLKLRLDIKDVTDDTLLAAILDQTAGTIEGVAGRTLRRDHARTEVCNGNSDLLRVNVSPIAKVHSIRESETGDFVTAANYAELVEGTDFFIEGGLGGDSGRPGEPALIRRLGNLKWMGAWAGVVARTRVMYTGGFKTDEEKALENSKLTISSVSDIEALELHGLLNVASPHLAKAAWLHRYDSTSQAFQYASSCYPLDPYAASYAMWAILRFKLSQIILPTWQIDPTQLTLSFSVAGDASVPKYGVVILPFDPSTRKADELVYRLWGKQGYLATELLTLADTLDLPTDADTLPHNQQVAHSTFAQADAIMLAIREGVIAFAFQPAVGNTTIQVGMPECTAAENRPSVTLSHRVSFFDVFTVPDDLRNANILQAIHEYQTRKTPGMISQAMRGVSIASGASYMKTLAALLPEVEAVAMHYRRLY